MLSSLAGTLGDAVRNDVDAVRRDAVDVGQRAGAEAAHHHQPLGGLGDLFDHAALRQARPGEDGVQGRDDRHAQLAQERQQQATGSPAEDAELVLHGHQVDAVDVEIVGGPAVRRRVGFGDLESHAARIGVLPARIVHRHHEAVDPRRRLGEGAAEMGGEGGDPALPRQVVANHADAADQRVHRHVGAGRPHAVSTGGDRAEVHGAPGMGTGPSAGGAGPALRTPRATIGHARGRRGVAAEPPIDVSADDEHHGGEREGHEKGTSSPPGAAIRCP